MEVLTAVTWQKELLVFVTLLKKTFSFNCLGVHICTTESLFNVILKIIFRLESTFVQTIYLFLCKTSALVQMLYIFVL